MNRMKTITIGILMLFAAFAFADNILVEVHESKEGNKLFYRVGTMGTSSVDIVWGTATEYTSGKSPKVAMNGEYVVFVHQGYNNEDLYCTVGVVNKENKTLDLGQPTRFIKKAARPSVALNGKDVVVTYQKVGSESLLYMVGSLEPENRKIVFAAEKKYESGNSPSVAMDKK